MLYGLVLKEGGEVIWTKVGASTVARKLMEIKGLLAGEENGGIFYPPHQPVRDGAMTTALISDLLTRNNTSLSSLIKTLPKYFILKSGKACPNQDKQKVLQYLLDATEGQERST